SVTDRPPKDVELVTGETIAGLLHMGRAAQFECEMMQAAHGSTGEVQRVMFVATAHEDEAVLDPVRDPQAHDVRTELRRRKRIRRTKSDMAELGDGERTDPLLSRRRRPTLDQFELRS